MQRHQCERAGNRRRGGFGHDHGGHTGLWERFRHSDRPFTGFGHNPAVDRIAGQLILFMPAIRIVLLAGARRTHGEPPVACHARGMAVGTKAHPDRS